MKVHGRWFRWTKNRRDQHRNLNKKSYKENRKFKTGINRKVLIPRHSQTHWGRHTEIFEINISFVCKMGLLSFLKSLYSFSPVYAMNILSKFFFLDSAKVNFCPGCVCFSWFSELTGFTEFQTDTPPGAELSSYSILPHNWLLGDQLSLVSLDAMFFMDVIDVH